VMLGGDPDGRIYRSAVAVADRWCHQVPQCDGSPGVASNMCPLNASNLCKGKGQK
jgi:hypothetical protein